MFTHNPEPKEIFNMSNQRNGDQREALFNRHCRNLRQLNIETCRHCCPAVGKNRPVKHTSFQIKPEQYNIVGDNLLATLDEMFSPGGAGRMGQSLRRAGKYLYSSRIADSQRKCQQERGLEGTRAFRIVEKTPQRADYQLRSRAGRRPAGLRIISRASIPIWQKPEGFRIRRFVRYSFLPASQTAKATALRLSVKQRSGIKLAAQRS